MTDCQVPYHHSLSPTLPSHTLTITHTTITHTHYHPHYHHTHSLSPTLPSHTLTITHTTITLTLTITITHTLTVTHSPSHTHHHTHTFTIAHTHRQCHTLRPVTPSWTLRLRAQTHAVAEEPGIAAAPFGLPATARLCAPITYNAWHRSFCAQTVLCGIPSISPLGARACHTS